MRQKFITGLQEVLDGLTSGTFAVFLILRVTPPQLMIHLANPPILFQTPTTYELLVWDTALWYWCWRHSRIHKFRFYNRCNSKQFSNSIFSVKSQPTNKSNISVVKWTILSNGRSVQHCLQVFYLLTITELFGGRQR